MLDEIITQLITRDEKVKAMSDVELLDTVEIILGAYDIHSKESALLSELMERFRDGL